MTTADGIVCAAMLVKYSLHGFNRLSVIECLKGELVQHSQANRDTELASGVWHV